MSNSEQQEFWTDEAGPIWVAQRTVMDDTLAPVLDLVLSRATLTPGAQVLDIGCGAGTSTLQAARIVGTAGHACGVDISSPLLALARKLADGLPNVSFLQADAQDHDFPPHLYDTMISRFGVMFFDDTAAAFANMAGALKPGGRMVFATWGAIPENPYFTLPARVARTVIGAVPKTDPDAPGPFALRDAGKVTDMLSNAGLTGITADEIALDLTPPGDARQVAELLCRIGPAHRALTHFETDADDRKRLVAALMGALAPYRTEGGIRIPALINLFTAQT